MPDYTSILRRSIAALPDSSPEMRAAVYQRARAALARQLTAVEPPLSTREIEAQHQELENAVAKLEAEYAPPEPVARPEPAPIRDEVPLARPQSAAPLVEPAEAGGGDLDSRPPLEDDEGPDIDEGEDEFEDDEQPSRVPLLVGILLLVLVIGGIGAYSYAERGAILALFGGSDAQEEQADTGAPPIPVVTPAPEPQTTAAVADDDGTGKRLDRLTNGSEPAPAEVSEPVEAAPPEAPPATAAPEPEPEPAIPAEPAVEAAPAAEPPADQAPQTPEPEQQTAALGEGTQSIVAQRAIYYLQGTDNAPGRVVQGNVTWAETVREGAPAVQATLRLPEQEVATTVTIYKNNDKNLPASHLVEVQFSGELGSTPIQRVPALVLKQTEQARGQPLAGAAVPVTNELFWIALSDDPDQIAKNLQLLREGSWFDIPILFNDGTRALLTFEKGIPGDKVFETVMSSWTPA